MLSELDMMSLWAKQLTGYASQWERLFGFGYAVEAEVRKQDDALIRQLVEALERAKKHHFTTSLPLVIENYGSKIKCANEGSIVWRDLVPSAIAAGQARLETHHE